MVFILFIVCFLGPLTLIKRGIAWGLMLPSNGPERNLGLNVLVANGQTGLLEGLFIIIKFQNTEVFTENYSS